MLKTLEKRERVANMDGRMNFSTIKIRQLKKRKKENHIDETKNSEIELVKTKHADECDKLQNALKELKKIEIIDKILHEIKNEILREENVEFEKKGKLSIGDHKRQTHSRCKNFTDYENYVNAIDQNYESDDSIFNSYVYKENTPQFNVANRSEYGNGNDFKHQIIEYPGKKCYIPSKDYCFIKCNNFLTGKDYKQVWLEVFRNEDRKVTF